ncbi:hypothetical protein L249_2310 [Ophiocordyceps polyrhachis-furcata BCC 54312]|uniref:Uncharacterized protein n=1 Tax=Ophiocordyceps polyrhachis-furcata BCC 54312 TaxID=1330021 RepID=A0A367LNP7_9HYPO|nr:hypothetical protein L249_2310 [Ophiocordyceps polyrhachis-furcata BCC 54312]
MMEWRWDGVQRGDRLASWHRIHAYYIRFFSNLTTDTGEGKARGRGKQSYHTTDYGVLVYPRTFSHMGRKGTANQRRRPLWQFVVLPPPLVCFVSGRKAKAEMTRGGRKKERREKKKQKKKKKRKKKKKTPGQI